MDESVELKYCLQLFGMFLLKFDIDVMFCIVNFYCFLYKLYAITVEIITDLEVIFQKSALSVSHQRNESVYIRTN